MERGVSISDSLIHRISFDFSNGAHSFSALPTSRTTERDLVCGVLQILQGLSNPLFFWDDSEQQFCARSGIYVPHLSHTSLTALLSQFLFAATCLQLVHLKIGKLEASSRRLTPTMKAFSCSISTLSMKLRNTASLEEEKQLRSAGTRSCSTLLSLTSTLSSLCSGAEYLLQTVNGAIPPEYLEFNCDLPPSQMAAHVLNYLYTLLDQLYLVRGPEEEPFKMVLWMFTKTLLPYIEVLDLWIHEGTLYDPFEEMYFYANKSVLVDDPVFWEKSYLLRHVKGDRVCPIFLLDLADSVISAGKSLQLLRCSPRVLLQRSSGRQQLTLSEVFCLSLENHRSSRDRGERKAASLNPVISVCRNLLDRNRRSWGSLNLSGTFHIPSLENGSKKKNNNHNLPEADHLFPFPTLLPFYQEGTRVSEPKDDGDVALPALLVRGLLTGYVEKQVNHVGGRVLSGLMNEWLLMEELTVLRAVYFLGSGDMLQHFITVVFNKMDREEKPWATAALGDASDDDAASADDDDDGDFELNTVLQQSIRYSADANLLRFPDALVVTIVNRHHHHHHQMDDALTRLRFTYKVPWPLEIIINAGAVDKYNQVMRFLLKLKRAKYALDRVRVWLWKDRRRQVMREWCLVEQKLLHFVETFHVHVMDVVHHQAWNDLSSSVSRVGSLDDVVSAHDSYLSSILRHCFILADKLGHMILSRVDKILSLASQLYSLQRGFDGGGGGDTAAWRSDVFRIDRQFDGCIAFLLRVLSSKSNAGRSGPPPPPHLQEDLATRLNFNSYYHHHVFHTIKDYQSPF